MKPLSSHASRWLPAALALVLAASALAQDPLPTVRIPYPIDSGAHSNPGTVPDVVISFPVVVAGARWMRLEFDSVRLSGDVLSGQGAVLRITSLLDGAVQELDDITLRQWRSTSAYFNGEALLVEVVAHPGSGLSRVVLAAVQTELDVAPDSICGPSDDRAPSSDDRVGRILPVGCTGWVIDDCTSCLLTAGHCVGVGLQTLQFQVPRSDLGGFVQHPPPEHQYAVDASSVQSGQGIGEDWGYFGVFPNSNTGWTPYRAYGVRFTLAPPPPFDPLESIRVTGYGTRVLPAEWNQVQETHVGPWTSLIATTVGYAVDTTGGNSGSPVIHEPTGAAIGIHTHGGCWGGENRGTASDLPELAAALATPAGVCASGISAAEGAPRMLPPGQPTQVECTVRGPIVPGSALLHYRSSGGPFQPIALAHVGGETYSATLPAPACWESPEFYFSVVSLGCGVLTDPPGAPANFHSATVESPSFVDSFELNKGWATTSIGAIDGFWQRGVPVDDPVWLYDPASDADGSGACFLTQNVLGNTDVDGGSVILTSPALDFSGESFELRYSYFLRLTSLGGQDRLEVEASPSGAPGSWRTIATHDTDGGLSWRPHVVTSAEIEAAGVALAPDARVRFIATDDGTDSVVESGVDGFAIVRDVCTTFTTYCQTGALGSRISATGSASLAANDLILHASQVPPGKLGRFFFSPTKLLKPFGNGFRCVGAPSSRLPMVGSGAGGTLDCAVDFTGGSAMAFSPGATWFFQAWFRDGSHFDLSDGLRVVFEP